MKRTITISLGLEIVANINESRQLKKIYNKGLVILVCFFLAEILHIIFN